MLTANEIALLGLDTTILSGWLFYKLGKREVEKLEIQITHLREQIKSHTDLLREALSLSKTAPTLPAPEYAKKVKGLIAKVTDAIAISDFIKPVSQDVVSPSERMLEGE